MSDKTVKDDIFKGRYQLVLISPELLMTNLYWREMMRTEVYQKRSTEIRKGLQLTKCLHRSWKNSEKRTKMPRIIIFCRKCEECAELYKFFYSALKDEFTEPVGAPNLVRYRLVDMFMSATDQTVKESIVK